MRKLRFNPSFTCLGFAAVGLLLAGTTASGADRIKADTTNALNTAGSWTANATVGVNDTAIWDATVSAANATNGFAVNANTWGGIRISNPPVTVNILSNYPNLANANRVLRLGALGIEVAGTQNLIIDHSLVTVSPQTWQIGAGRVFEQQSSRATTNGADTVISGPGTLLLNRAFDVTSNAVVTLTNDIVFDTATGSDSPVVRVAQGAAGNGTINQVSGAVTLRRSTSAGVLLIGNSANTGTYGISGGSIDARDNGITKQINVGAAANSAGIFNVSGTGQVLAAVINIGNNATQTGGQLNASGNGFVEAHNIVVANNGPGTLTVSGSATVIVTNTFRIGANTPNFGVATVNLDGGNLVVGGLLRGTGDPTNTSGVFRFNGGTLTALRPSLDFAAVNVSNAAVRLEVMVGGAVINTSGNSITNRSPLLDGDGLGGGLTKQGAGSLTLLGTNTYTGPTLVQGGGLVLATTVNGGAGSVTVADSAALTVQVDIPGTSLAASTVTLGNAALGFDATTNGNPTAPAIVATDLVRNGLSTVNVAASGVGLSVGTFTLISSANPWTGSGDFVLGGLPAGVNATLVTNGNNLDLNVLSVPLNLTWNGTPTGEWAVGAPANWQGGLSYADGSFLTFDDTAAGTTAINVSGVVAPGGVDVVFNHSTLAYTLSGAGSITGAVGLTKLGTATLTIGASNTYAGPTTISAGTVQLSASEVIPNGIGQGSVVLDGTLDVAGNLETINGLSGTGTVDNSAGVPGGIAVGSGNISSTFNGAITDSGAALGLAKVGAGTLTLQSVNTYSGGTDVAGGILRVDPGVTLGDVAAPWRLAANLLTLASLTNTAPQIEVSGTGTLTISNPATVSIAGLIVSTNDGILVKAGDGTLNLAQGGVFGALRPENGLTVLAPGQGITNNAFVNLGNVAAATATMVLDNSVWSVANGGAIDFNIANANGSSGILHITNNARLEVEDFWIGKIQNTTGTVYQSSGVVTNVADLGDPIRFAGNNNAAHSTAVARYFLSGGRFDVIDETQIGANGNALLEITGGEFNSWSGALSVGRYAGSVGTVTVTSGSFNRLTNENFTLANAGTATLNVSGSGVVNLAGNLVMGSAANSTSVVNLATGGLIRAARVLDGAGVSTFNFNGGTLEAGSSSTDFMRTLTNVFVSSANARISTSTNDITILQSLVENPLSTGGGLIKTGTGTLTLAGTNNTYTGPTTVSEGTLLVSTQYVGLSAFNVSAGAAFGARRSAANSFASVGLASFANGSTLDIGLGTSGNSATPVLIVTEDTGLSASGAVNIRLSGGNLTPGTITLIAYNNGIGGDGFAAFQAGTLTLPTGVAGTLNDTGSSIELVITSVAPLVWTGAIDNLWDINTTTNWSITNVPTVYLDNDAALLFGDSGANKSISIPANVAPTQITVTNTVGNDYTFGGDGLITGSGGITKAGSGTLVLANGNNTYNGATLINAGTLRFGTNDVLPNSATSAQTVDIAAGATLDVNGFNDTIRAIAGAGTIDNAGASNAVLIIGANGASGSFSGVVQDTAGDLLIQKNGAGTNLLSNAASTWNGGLFINAGVIEFNNNHVFGAGPVIIGAGGTLANLGSRSITNLVLGTNSGTATFNTAGGDLSLAGVVTFDGPELAKSGANTLTIEPSAVVSLGTPSGFDLNGGSLVINGGTWTHANDGFRTRATTNFPLVTVTMQNNAVVTLAGGGNLQLGNTADTNLTTLTRVTNVFNLVSGTLTMGTAAINVGSFIGNAGVFIQSAGTVTSTNTGNNNGVVLGAATNTSGIYELNGGTLVTARVRKTGTNDTFARFVFGGGTLRALNNNAVATTNFMSGLDEALVRAAGAKIDTDAFDIDIAQTLTEDPSSTGGGLFKGGSGALAMNGASTYTGPTVVSNGVLRGLGSVPTSVTGAGRIGGGDRVTLGTFTINGNSTATGGAVMRLNKSGVVLTNDKVVVTGTLNLSGDLIVTASGDALAAGDSFDLFDAGLFAGNFTSRSLPVLAPGLSWDTSTVNTTGVIRVVTSPAVTSITYGPGTVQIVGTGDAALAGQNYRVLSSTDMALPYTSWTVVFTGVFDGSGNFDTGAFAVTPSDTRRFYVVVYP